MTKKEFITNFLRGIGYDVLYYTPEKNGGVHVGVLSPEGKGQITVYADRSDSNLNYTSVKFKWSHTTEGIVHGTKAEMLIRKANAWLHTRQFENCVADFTPYRVSFMRLVSPDEHRGYLRLRCSKDYPWNQCAKNLTKDEIIEDAFGEQKRYKGVGIADPNVPKFDW